MSSAYELNRLHLALYELWALLARRDHELLPFEPSIRSGWHAQLVLAGQRTYSVGRSASSMVDGGRAEPEPETEPHRELLIQAEHLMIEHLHVGHALRSRWIWKNVRDALALVLGLCHGILPDVVAHTVFAVHCPPHACFVPIDHLGLCREICEAVVRVEPWVDVSVSDRIVRDAQRTMQLGWCYMFRLNC